MNTKTKFSLKKSIVGIIPVVLTILVLILMILSCQDDPVDETSGNFTDTRDGHVYKWVKIGDQVWMAENLAWLPNVSPPSAVSSTSVHYYVNGYNGSSVSAAKNTQNYKTYGVLYNWPSALTACPAGWHLPGDSEWTTLTDYLINNGYGYQGSGDDIAKSIASTTGWNSNSYPGTPGNDPASNNSSGFSGLPGGVLYSDGSFDSVGDICCWWSSSGNSTKTAWFRSPVSIGTKILREAIFKEDGFSVRCLQD